MVVNSALKHAQQKVSLLKIKYLFGYKHVSNAWDVLIFAPTSQYIRNTVDPLFAETNTSNRISDHFSTKSNMLY